MDFEHLKEACKNTFKHRSTDFNIDSILDVLVDLKMEKDLKTRWSSYQKKFSYAGEINFDAVIDIMIELVKNIR